MKIIILFFVLASFLQNISVEAYDFKEYINKFNKIYQSTEYDRRYRIYTRNLEKIKQFNRNSKTFKMGINEFTDLTDEEFQKRHLERIETSNRPKKSKYKDDIL